MSELKARVTPIPDLVRMAKEHYEEIATQAMHHSSFIPQVLDEYEDLLKDRQELSTLRQNLKEAIADITMIAEYNSGTGIHQFEPINKITLERIIGIFRLHNLIQEE